MWHHGDVRGFLGCCSSPLLAQSVSLACLSVNCSLGMWEVAVVWDQGPCKLKFGKFWWIWNERWFCLLFIVPSLPCPQSLLYPVLLSLLPPSFFPLAFFICPFHFLPSLTSSLPPSLLPLTDYIPGLCMLGKLHNHSYSLSPEYWFERGFHHVDQAGPELTEIYLPLPSNCWN